MLILELEVTDEQAWALAQMVKRFGYTDAESLSASKPETDTMIQAVIELQKALDRVGISPR